MASRRDTVLVLTSESTEAMIRAGGTGNWKANKNSVGGCKWVVAVRNRTAKWPAGEEEHGAAVLIGRLIGVKPVGSDGRLQFVFDRYAELNVPNLWPPSYRNPVAYKMLEDLGIDPAQLDWRDVSKVQQPAASGGEAQPSTVVIEKARLMIAQALSVDPAAVRITVDV